MVIRSYEFRRSSSGLVADDKYSRPPYYRHVSPREKYDNLREPQWFWEKMVDVFGSEMVTPESDFDPEVETFITAKTRDKPIFCLPPFSQAAKYLEAGLIDHLKTEAPIVILISARTEAHSWHDHVFGKATIVFVRGPFKFIGLEKGLSAALIIYGQVTQEQMDKLLDLGTIITPANEAVIRPLSEA